MGVRLYPDRELFRFTWRLVQFGDLLNEPLVLVAGHDSARSVAPRGCKAIPALCVERAIGLDEMCPARSNYLQPSDRNVSTPGNPAARTSWLAPELHWQSVGGPGP